MVDVRRYCPAIPQDLQAQRSDLRGPGGMSALLIVDVQNDFITGSLAVENGESVVPGINKLLSSSLWGLRVATQDWHPAGHISFASRHDRKPLDTVVAQGVEVTLWPDHCLQNSWGSALHSDLNTLKIDKIVQKGEDIDIECLSGFKTVFGGTSTNLTQLLKALAIKQVYVAGLAMDFCVYWTALDAVKNGFQVSVIRDATLPVSQEGGERALKGFAEHGVKTVSIADILE